MSLISGTSANDTVPANVENLVLNGNGLMGAGLDGAAQGRTAFDSGGQTIDLGYVL